MTPAGSKMRKKMGTALMGRGLQGKISTVPGSRKAELCSARCVFGDAGPRQTFVVRLYDAAGFFRQSLVVLNAQRFDLMVQAHGRSPFCRVFPRRACPFEILAFMPVPPRSLYSPPDQQIRSNLQEDRP